MACPKNKLTKSRNYTLPTGHCFRLFFTVPSPPSEIPLDRIPLLRFIDLTPNWEEDSELYLSPLPEPLQSKVREMIKELEKIHRKLVKSDFFLVVQSDSLRTVPDHILKLSEYHTFH